MYNAEVEKNSISRLEKLAGIKLPDFALLIIISILPLFNGGVDHKATNLGLFLALAVAIWLIVRKNSVVETGVRLPFIFFGLFLLWSGISIFWSIAPHRTLIELLEIGLYGTVMFVAIHLSTDAYYRIGRVLVVLGVLLVIHGALQNVLLGITTVNSTFHHHNSFGIYMAMLFLCAWGYYNKHGSKVTFIVSVIFLIGLFISGSRGALLALLVCLPLLLVNIPLNRQTVLTFVTKTIACLIIAFLLATVIISTPPLLIDEKLEEQVASILGRPDYLEAQNIFARFSYWEVGLEQLQSKPLEGYGLGTFYATYLMADYWPANHFARFAHNHYLQTFVETGVIGFLLLTGFLLSTFFIIKNAFGIRKLSLAYPGVLSALLVYLIHIGIDFSWNSPAVSVLFFGLLGMLFGYRNRFYETKDCNNCSNIKYAINAGRLILLTAAIPLFLLNIWHYSAFLFYWQSTNAQEVGNYEKAVAIYDTVNSFYPINGMAFYVSSYNRLALYQKSGDRSVFDKALADAKKAVELNPVEPLTRNNLGLFYIITGNDQAAQEQLFLGHKYSKDYIIRYLNSAKDYLSRDNVVVAEHTALRGLGHSKYVLRVSSGTEAEDDMIRAVADLHLVLVEAYEAQGNLDQADKHLRLAEEIMPDHPSLENIQQ